MSRLILQVTLTPSEVLVPVFNFSDARFPFRTPGGPFSSLSVAKANVFVSNSQTVSPVREPSDPTGYYNPERCARASFQFFQCPFPFPDPRWAVFEPECWKSPRFRF